MPFVSHNVLMLLYLSWGIGDRTCAKQEPDEAKHRRGGGCGSLGFKTAACRLGVVRRKGRATYGTP
jgi:hypothetical protein